MLDTSVAVGKPGHGVCITKSRWGTRALHFQRRNKRWTESNAGVAFDKVGICSAHVLGGINHAESFFEISGRGRTAYPPLWAEPGMGPIHTRALIFVKGLFLGTTLQGGTRERRHGIQDYSRRHRNVLHSFTGGADGSNPSSALGSGCDNTSHHNFAGGTSHLGTVFTLIRSCMERSRRPRSS